MFKFFNKIGRELSNSLFYRPTNIANIPITFFHTANKIVPYPSKPLTLRELVQQPTQGSDLNQWLRYWKLKEQTKNIDVTKLQPVDASGLKKILEEVEYVFKHFSVY